MGADEDRAVIAAVGDLDALDRALSAGGSPDVRGTDGRTALEVAIECDDVSSLRRLIEAGANVNAAMANGWTPLHMAVDFEGDCNVQNELPMVLRHVKPLLDAGADPEAVFTSGQESQTPLDMAVYYEHTLAVEAMRRALGRGGGARA
ncbi:MAG: ankyrin repeat domain-containing protein [Actinomycetota bacterium]